VNAGSGNSAAWLNCLQGDAIAAFVAESEWAQFHTPENLAANISIEAAELLTQVLP
jgi:hypothetical protein